MPPPKPFPPHTCHSLSVEASQKLKETQDYPNKRHLLASILTFLPTLSSSPTFSLDSFPLSFIHYLSLSISFSAKEWEGREGKKQQSFFKAHQLLTTIQRLYNIVTIHYI